MTLTLDFKVTAHGVTIDAIDVLCAQLSRDLFAIAKFLLFSAMRTLDLCSLVVRRCRSG